MAQRPADWTSWLNVEGCGFVVVTGLLLVMNAMLLHLVCTALSAIQWNSLQQALANPKVIQAVLLIGSVLMVFGQWWVIERMTARWFPRRTKESEAAESPEERAK
jgi:hypothetical protein